MIQENKIVNAKHDNPNTLLLYTGGYNHKSQKKIKQFSQNSQKNYLAFTSVKMQ